MGCVWEKNGTDGVRVCINVDTELYVRSLCSLYCVDVVWVQWCFRSLGTRLFVQKPVQVNTLRPRQNGRQFPDNIFKCIFLNENVSISIKVSLKFVPKGRIDNYPVLVQIMAGRLPGDKPLSEPMLTDSLTHKCSSRWRWVNDKGDIIGPHYWALVSGESTGDRWVPFTNIHQWMPLTKRWWCRKCFHVVSFSCTMFYKY